MEFSIKKNILYRGTYLIIMTIIIVYFAFHTMIGDRGLFTLLKLESELTKKQLILRNMNQEILFLENKAQGLYEDTLNIDLLEEEVKRNLGYIRNDEMVIYEEDF